MQVRIEPFKVVMSADFTDVTDMVMRHSKRDSLIAAARRKLDKAA